MNRSAGKKLLAATFIVLSLGPLSLFAQKNLQKVAVIAPASKGEQTDSFSYSAKDRRDPFEVLYQARSAKPTLSAQKKVGYELEELKVVGVVKSGTVKFAVMEDIQGKGLFFKKGDFINTGMWIEEILDNQIVFAHKLRGDVRKIPIDIPRKQEG
jgi:Tfp pilus assembly protein PilP